MGSKSKKGFSVMALILSITFIMAVLAGCSGGSGNSESGNNQGAGASAAPGKEPSESASSEAASTGIDTSKKVELQFYMLGDAPKDLPKIEAEINKMALEDLNATVKFNYTSWTDWDQKYKLLLSSGQQVDLIFTAEWTQYQSYAKQGAFQPLEELLPKASPALYQFVPQDMWEAVKIDNHIYTVPSTYKEYVTNGFVWREDLRKKYNLPEPKDLESYEAYMAGIKANEPDMIPVSLNSDVKGNLIDRVREFKASIGAVPYGIGINYFKPLEVTNYWGSQEQIDDLTMLKRWQDNGYIPKNVLNIKDTLQEQLTSGKAASIFGDNPTRFNDSVIKVQAAHPDWELKYYPFPLANKVATPVHPIHNGFAIPKSSKNAERALAFYEKMVTDKRYNQLTEYGIEGVNYTVDADGYYQMIGDSTSNGFPREAMNGWAWRNPDYMLFDKNYDGVKAIFDELDKIQVPDKFMGFAEDYSSYQPEKAALEQVEKQYLYPLLAGLVDDVNEGVNTFMAKAKQAGLEKIQEEYKKQWLAYANEKGLQ